MEPNNKKPADINIPNKLSSTTRNIRLYEDDDAALIKLCDLVKDVASITIVDLIRDCIRTGLPIIEARWSPLARESKRMKREQ